MVYFTVALMSRKNFRRITVRRDGFTADYFSSERRHITIQEGEADSFIFVGSDFHFEVKFGHVEDIRYDSGNKKEWEILLSDKTYICVEPED
jgi:hypothetical protein